MAPFQPSWNNYHLAANATPSAVPLPPMFGPPPLQPTVIANPYAVPLTDYATSMFYQVPQVYHSPFHQTSPGVLGYQLSHPPSRQLTQFPQPTPAGQFRGPTHPYMFPPLEPGAEWASRLALPTASRVEASVPQSGSNTPVGRQTERTKRTKQTPFAMWVGNIDSGVTVQDLYEFFRQIDVADPQLPEEGSVVSIFLIPKSNCAFVNFRTDAALTRGITRFHGSRLRLDPGAPRLACRRRTDDHGNLDGEWDEGGNGKGVQE